VVIVAGADGVVRAWEYATNRLLATAPSFELQVHGLAAADQSRIALRGPREIGVWDWNRNELTRWHDRSEGRLIAITPDARVVATADFDSTLRFWNAASGELVREVKTASYISSLAMSADGSMVAVGEHDGTVEIFRVMTGAALQRLPRQPDRVSAVAFGDRDASIVSVAAQNSRSWDLQSARVRWEGHSDRSFANLVVLSPDAKLALVATGSVISTDNSYRVVDLQSGTVMQKVTAHTSPISDAAFNPMSNFVVSGGWDQSVVATDLRNRTQIASLRLNPPTVLEAGAFSPTGDGW
jgi:WD40 repeat protein